MLVHWESHDGTIQVVSSLAKMPANCWGTYRRVAVIRSRPGKYPKAIDARVCEVLRTYERLYSGKSKRCAFGRALEEAIDYAERLEKEHATTR